MQGGRRRRFGVSIPEELASQLDEIATAMGRDRSSLVAEALRTYIHDHVHLARPHRCRGVLVVWSRRGSAPPELHRMVEEFNDVIIGYMHAHLDDYCVDVMLVAGGSERIAGLARRASQLPGCTARYIPLSGPGDDGEREPRRAGDREATRGA